jgi:hypothetical protein
MAVLYNLSLNPSPIREGLVREGELEFLSPLWQERPVLSPVEAGRGRGYNTKGRKIPLFKVGS